MRGHFFGLGVVGPAEQPEQAPEDGDHQEARGLVLVGLALVNIEEREQC